VENIISSSCLLSSGITGRYCSCQRANGQTCLLIPPQKFWSNVISFPRLMLQALECDLRLQHVFHATTAASVVLTITATAELITAATVSALLTTAATAVFATVATAVFTTA
jgi:hypothetical protein